MALIVKDRVLETCSTSGLVDFTLTGAVTGYQRFSAIGNGNTTYYAAYVIGSNDWEVGIGTVGTSSLTRDTILSSSTGSKVNFTGNPVVWCDLPSSKALFTDSANNASANSFLGGFTSVAASATPITLTVASTPDYVVTGSGGQTIKLPDATTLPNGTVFSFDNNQSSGAITVNNNSNTLVVSVPSGGYVYLRLLSNAIAAGSWDRHDLSPSNVSWSTNTFDYPGSITSATWNGSTVAYNRGGTGQSSAFVAGGIVYGSSTTALAVTAIGTTGQALLSNGESAPTWGTLGVGAGGTGQTTFTANQVLYGNGTSALSSSANMTFNGTLLSVTGNATVNGTAINKNLYLEGGNNLVLNSATLSTQNITVTANQYTLSMTGTGTITLSGTSSGTLVGSGVNTTVTKTFTPTAGTLTLTPTGSCTTVQLELGGVASAYTATTGSAVTTTNNVYVPSGQTLVGNGTASLPSFAFANQTNLGLYNNNGALAISTGGAIKAQFTSATLAKLQLNGELEFSFGTGPILAYDANNILGQRNSTNAQTFRLYNTYTDASNYERHSHVWSSNVLYAKNENAGTGSARLYIPVTGATTVASLPSASTAGVGARSFVTDALAPSFGVAVSGGGAVKIPVYSDGTSWYVG